ncbi:MAG: RNA polymerase sigma factor [Magnetococcales bacterium]|nr:RNA polymerase sigma factor [Magnetococcales bacterium]
MRIKEPLVKRAQLGDRDAFAALLEQNYDRIYRFAYRWCGHAQDAEEITQEVCIKLGRVMGSFRGESAFSSWLYRITLNVAKDYMRRSRHTRERTDHEEVLEYQPDQRAGPERALISRLILLCIEQLPEGIRETVLLVHAEGLNHRQAGETLACAEGTISWRLSEARKALTICLDKGAS